MDSTHRPIRTSRRRMPPSAWRTLARQTLTRPRTPSPEQWGRPNRSSVAMRAIVPILSPAPLAKVVRCGSRQCEHARKSSRTPAARVPTPPPFHTKVIARSDVHPFPFRNTVVVVPIVESSPVFVVVALLSHNGSASTEPHNFGRAGRKKTHALSATNSAPTRSPAMMVICSQAALTAPAPTHAVASHGSRVRFGGSNARFRASPQRFAGSKRNFLARLFVGCSRRVPNLAAKGRLKLSISSS